LTKDARFASEIGTRPSHSASEALSLVIFLIAYNRTSNSATSTVAEVLAYSLTSLERPAGSFEVDAAIDGIPTRVFY